MSLVTVLNVHEDYAFHVSAELRQVISELSLILRDRVIPLINIPNNVEEKYKDFMLTLDKVLLKGIVLDDKISPEDIRVLVDFSNWLFTNIVSTVHYKEEERT